MRRGIKPVERIQQHFWIRSRSTLRGTALQPLVLLNVTSTVLPDPAGLQAGQDTDLTHWWQIASFLAVAQVWEGATVHALLGRLKH